MKTAKLRKAVIPVGLEGEGLQSVSPTETLSVVDKSLVQYAVEEALASGLEELIFVTPLGLAIAEDHFDAGRPSRAGDSAPEVVGRPRSWGPAGRARQILICRQNKPGGVVQALWSARNLIGEEAFAVLMPADLLLGEVPAMAQMIAQYEEHGGNVVAVADDDLRQREGTFGAITAGSRGRYILQPDVFRALERQETLDLNEAIHATAEAWSLRAVAVKGHHFDCRTAGGLSDAQRVYARGHRDLTEVMDDVFGRYRGDGFDRKRPGAVSGSSVSGD